MIHRVIAGETCHECLFFPFITCFDTFYVESLSLWGQNLEREIESARRAKDLPEGRTMFHKRISSETLPESEKATKRLGNGP